ncbi:hypothetical protein TNCV_1680741 [Trichonephila clavipes]|nr:hypothetical protein TNCV_1680741 [Trichonephila clavipes]
MNMHRYTNAEFADIHFIYDLANGNGRVSVRLYIYGEIYPTRRQLNFQTFTRVHQNFAEHGSFRATIDNTPIYFKMDLVARISNAASTIRETHSIFEHVRQSIPHRCRACMTMAAISTPPGML